MLAVDISDIFVPIYQTSRRCKQNDRTMNLHHCKACNLNYVRGKANRYGYKIVSADNNLIDDRKLTGGFVETVVLALKWYILGRKEAVHRDVC